MPKGIGYPKRATKAGTRKRSNPAGRKMKTMPKPKKGMRGYKTSHNK